MIFFAKKIHKAVGIFGQFYLFDTACRRNDLVEVFDSKAAATEFEILRVKGANNSAFEKDVAIMHSSPCKYDIYLSRFQGFIAK
jgi:hypothetical protein